MKALLVTGQLAQDIVAQYAKESTLETKIIALKIAVAAFLTPKTIVEQLKNANLSDFNVIFGSWAHARRYKFNIQSNRHPNL